jgi:polyisoprenyl-teichoic acid--peptidoglycan teichoic acid transferase
VITLPRVRLLQLLGLLLALMGLIGFWLNRDVERVELSTEQRELINLPPNTFNASFVIAGRDYDHTQEASPCVWREGVCYRDRIGEFVYSKRTDTILYVQIVGDKVTMINLPRDVYLPNWETKINAMYFYQGAEGLKRTVEEIVGVPVDYYAIINLDIFKDFVDELGGVEVNIPYRMYHRDAAAGFEINLDPGPRLLNGEDASGFIRYRDTPRGDIDRIDNLKTLAAAMLKRLRELNVAAATKIPGLVDAFFSNVETNATPALIKQLIPYISRIQLQAATIPTYILEARPNDLFYDVEDVESFMAQTFGGEARDFVLPPDVTLLITNRSEIDGLADHYRQRLIDMGLDTEAIFAQESSVDPAPTRLLTSIEHWQDADYFTSLFQISKSQVDHIDFEGEVMDLELVLGKDAANISTTLSQR